MKDITLTKSQQRAFENLQRFLDDRDAKAFILKGYAGTGKTTLVNKIIEELEVRKQRVKLLASTGRAAKILANTTGRETRTIHGEIYTFKDLNQELESVAKHREARKEDTSGQLYLNFELIPRDCEDDEEEYYYIVDESSMVSDKKDNTAVQATFGTGRLLSDLLAYDPKGRFIFVGDICQLPPVQEVTSPALTAKYLQEEHKLLTYESELTEVVRQKDDNDIVKSAQQVRRLYYSPQPWKWAKFPFRNYKNIHIVENQTTLINKYVATIREKGFNAATMLCFTNRQSQQTTQILRPIFGHNTPLLEPGDLLLVTQNNLISGLMNGDLVEVKEVIVKERRAGLTFLKVVVKELFTQIEYSQLMIAEVLYGNMTNISQVQQKELFIDFYYRMKDRNIKQHTQAFKSIMVSDPYLNALRAVYGYVLTCHKSQGGEWDYVFLDIPKSVPALEKPYVYQWVYTAMTRARKELYIVDDFWVM